MARTKQDVLRQVSALRSKNKKKTANQTKQSVATNSSVRGKNKKKTVNQTQQIVDSNSSVVTSLQGKKYPCDICPKSYSKFSNLNQHIKRKHLNQIFTCPHCNESQSTKFAHIRHIERKHADRNEQIDRENVLELSESAKDKLIGLLKKQNELQKKEIEKLRKDISSLSAKNCPETTNTAESSSTESNQPTRPTVQRLVNKREKLQSNANSDKTQLRRIKLESCTETGQSNQQPQRLAKRIRNPKKDDIYVY